MLFITLNKAILQPSVPFLNVVAAQKQMLEKNRIQSLSIVHPSGNSQSFKSTGLLPPGRCIIIKN